jgi:thiol:disulfide interchange protein DsbD
VQWGLNLDQAREAAREAGKPVLIDFTGVNCANCRQMEQEVMARPEIVGLLERYVTVALYCDFVPIESIPHAQRESLAEANLAFQSELVRDVTQPFYVVLTPDGQVLDTIGGKVSVARYQAFLEGGLDRFAGKTRVARSD